MEFYQRLVTAGRGTDIRHDTDERWKLYYKTNGYNWISFTPDEAPCFDSNGIRIPHTKNSVVYFPSKLDRDLSFLMLNGKIAFCFWAAIGDDFDVTGDVLRCLPGAWDIGSAERLDQLMEMVADLRSACSRAIQYKRNAGRNVGTFNLSKCRHVTDLSDQVICAHFGDSLVWDEIELFYAQIVKAKGG